jgi:hypothetical protein
MLVGDDGVTVLKSSRVTAQSAVARIMFSGVVTSLHVHTEFSENPFCCFDSL